MGSNAHQKMPLLGNLGAHRGMSIKLVSSFSHLAGHYWTYTNDLANALCAHGVSVEVFASLPPQDSSSMRNPLIRWISCCTWSRFFGNPEKRNKMWNTRFEGLLRNLEFLVSFRRALLTNSNSHIHCIESRHRLLFNTVLSSKRSFSLLCVGSPSLDMQLKFGSLYTHAFSTGRIKLIAETESVRRDWEPFAGKHAVHIPVAVSTRKEAVSNKSSVRRVLGLPEDAFICLFYGTHREGKDYRTAIEAAKLAKSQPFLLFAGPLISGNDPHNLIKTSGYSNAIAWNHFFLDSEAAKFFDAADVVILPYAKGYEKGSAVLLQACKYGKPVVAANTGHLANFINSHKTGKLYTPEDPMDLAKVLDEMANIGKTESIELTERIQKTADFYSWKNLIRKYMDIFGL